MSIRAGKPVAAKASTENRWTRRLPFIDKEAAAFMRTAFSGRADVRFMLRNVPYRIRFVDEVPVSTVALALGLQVGATRGWLSFETTDLLGAEWGGLFGSIDPAFVQAMFLEEMAPALAQLARAGGEVVRVVQVTTDRRPRTDVPTQALNIENETSGVSVRAVLEQETVGFFTRLTAALRRMEPRTQDGPANACLPLSISLGVVWLRASEVAASQPGDVLIFPTTGTPKAVRAFCLDHRGTRLPIRALIERRGGRLMQYEGGDMADQQVDAAAKEKSADGLEEVSVPVTAVVGELELPLRELRSLKAGYVFELPTDLEQATVKLYTGQRCVGTGRLVAVGERLGVRLLEWGNANERQPA